LHVRPLWLPRRPPRDIRLSPNLKLDNRSVTPPGDGATITVLKVEDLPKIGRVIHVRADNIPVPGCAGIHLTNSINHIAVTDKMMGKSVNDLLREKADLPDSYFEGYREWPKLKRPQIVKDMTIADVVRRNADLPLICNFLPAKTT
jgi:hypothetical protein